MSVQAKLGSIVREHNMELCAQLTNHVLRFSAGVWIGTARTTLSAACGIRRPAQPLPALPWESLIPRSLANQSHMISALRSLQKTPAALSTIVGQ